MHNNHVLASDSKGWVQIDRKSQLISKVEAETLLKNTLFEYKSNKKIKNIDSKFKKLANGFF